MPLWPLRDLGVGYAGMLSLGHGIFFCAGAMRWNVPDAPGFRRRIYWPLCRSCRGASCPWFWWGTQHFLAMLLVVLVAGPAGAGIWLVCLPFKKSKVVSFLHHDPPLTFAGMLLFFRNETGLK